VEAHRSYERFEHGHRVATGEGGHAEPHYGHNAAMVVAVMAALLAVATFLSNEAVKEVVTGETHRADAAARLESNRVKVDIANGNSVLLRVLSAGGAQERRAAIEAGKHEARVAGELKPTDAHLGAGGAAATAGVVLLLVGLLM
jgi:hypothetical protein